MHSRLSVVSLSHLGDAACLSVFSAVERLDKQRHLFRAIRGQGSCTNLIAAIAYTCGVHKSLSLIAEEGEEDIRKNKLDPFLKKVDDKWDTDWIRQECKQERIRIDLVSALLKLGDCLDITKARIDTALFKDVVENHQVSDDVNINFILTKWIQFYLTDSVQVPLPEKKLDRLDIVVHYQIPKDLDRTEFLRFRNMAEEDFRDQSFIKVVEYYAQEKTRHGYDFSLKALRYFLREKYCENQHRDVPTIRIRYKLTISEVADPRLVKIIDALGEKEEHKRPDKGGGKRPDNPVETFPLFPKDFPLNDAPELSFVLPTSHHVLYLLNLFDRFATVPLTVQQVEERVGISRDQVLLICTHLAYIGYLEEVPSADQKAFIRSPQSRDILDAARNNSPGLTDLRVKGDTNEESTRLEGISKLLRRYREDPYSIRSKIHELETLGKLLPLENGTKEKRLSSGVPNLDQILNPLAGRDEGGGIVADRCILIKGPPGTGKTTFGMQFLWSNRSLQTLYLTFDEDLQQLKDDFEKFDWDLNSITIMPLRFVKQKSDRRAIFLEVTNILNKKEPDVLVIDSVNHLTEYMDIRGSRQLLSDLISVFKVRHITTVLIGEETPGYSFEEYLVDGIVKLAHQNDRRLLEVSKMRGQNHIEGRHSYLILDREMARKENWKWQKEGPYTSGINVFPNITYYVASAGNSEGQPRVGDLIATGTDGLDEMLPSSKKQEGERKEGGFIRGNTVLLAGTPGSGKTIMGLQFLKMGWIDQEDRLNSLRKLQEELENKKRNGDVISQRDATQGRGDTKNTGEDAISNLEQQVAEASGEIEGALWISFESSDKEDLKKSIDTFDDRLRFESLIDDESYFYFKHFSPAKLDFDEFVHVIAYHIRKHRVARICIDSVSDIMAQFESHPVQFKSNINSLCHYLTSKGVTTLLLYRMSQFFGEVESMGVEITSMVDTILAMKNLEVHNRIEKGITVLKIRGREHRGDIKPIVIDSRNGLRVRDIGWSMENLISGRPSRISEPFIFIKLFYENPAEDEIVGNAIKDFKSRYPSQRQFITSVRKPQIHTDYWSFGERRGPGHSNVKIFSISNYWAEAFQEKGRLHDLWEYVPERTREELEKIEDPFWSECRKAPVQAEAKEDKTASYFFIPHYVDLGVLTFRKKILEACWENTKGSAQNLDLIKRLIDSETDDDDQPLDYIEIENIFKSVEKWYNSEAAEEYRKDLGVLKYAFSMPALSEVPSFVAFFMEVVWAHGGDIYDFSGAEEGGVPEQSSLGNKPGPACTLEARRECIRDVFNGLVENTIYKVFRDARHEKRAGDDKASSDATNEEGTEFDLFAKYVQQEDEKTNEADKERKQALGELRDAIEGVKRLIAIDRPGPRKALELLKSWCTRVGQDVPLCGNPYNGDFSSESLFSRQWYSRINTVYRLLLLPKQTQDEKTGSEIRAGGGEEENPKEDESTREILLEQRKEQIGITLLPVVGKGPCCVGYDLVCLGLIKGSVSPETGWLFIDALMAPENINTRSQYRWGLPARREYYYRESFKVFDEVAMRIAERVCFGGSISRISEDKTATTGRVAETARSGDDADGGTKKGKVIAGYFGRIPYFAEIEGKIHKHLKRFFAEIADNKSPDPEATLHAISGEIKDHILMKVREIGA